MLSGLRDLSSPTRDWTLAGNRTVLNCPLSVRGFNINLRRCLQKVLGAECRIMSEAFCWQLPTFFIPEWPSRWRVFRNRQLEGISVVAQQFHETLEPLNEWLSTTEKRLANCEPVGTQASKLEEQIEQHKVRFPSHARGIQSSLSFVVLWHAFELRAAVCCLSSTWHPFHVSSFGSIYVVIFICPFFLFPFFKPCLGLRRWHPASQ